MLRAGDWFWWTDLYKTSEKKLIRNKKYTAGLFFCNKISASGREKQAINTYNSKILHGQYLYSSLSSPDDPKFIHTLMNKESVSWIWDVKLLICWSGMDLLCHCLCNFWEKTVDLMLSWLNMRRNSDPTYQAPVSQFPLPGCNGVSLPAHYVTAYTASRRGCTVSGFNTSFRPTAEQNSERNQSLSKSLMSPVRRALPTWRPRQVRPRKHVPTASRNM